MANIFIPLIVLIIILYGSYKKIDIYNKFIEGVEEGLSISLKLFPNMFAMILGINIIIKSNIINDITNIISPILKQLHYPKELIPLAILRPISSSASLAILDNILKTYNPDSIIGRIASVLQGSTDTTIYILGLYFSSINIKKTKYALIVGLLADLTAVIISCIIVNLLFN